MKTKSFTAIEKASERAAQQTSFFREVVTAHRASQATQTENTKATQQQATHKKK